MNAAKSFVWKLYQRVNHTCRSPQFFHPPQCHTRKQFVWLVALKIAGLLIKPWNLHLGFSKLFESLITLYLRIYVFEIEESNIKSPEIILSLFWQLAENTFWKLTLQQTFILILYQALKKNVLSISNSMVSIVFFTISVFNDLCKATSLKDFAVFGDRYTSFNHLDVPGSLLLRI